MFALLLALAWMPAALLAEQDGTFYRAIETPVIGSLASGQGKAVGIAYLPHGGVVVDGYIYITVHANKFNWNLPDYSYCIVNGVSQGETRLMFKAPFTASGVTQPWTYVGRAAACDEHLGSGGWTIGGTIAKGRSGYDGSVRYYVTGNRTKCTNWDQGCMDAEFLGAATSIEALATTVNDVTPGAWRHQPSLAISDDVLMPDGSRKTIGFNSFIELKSYDYDPAPPYPFDNRQSSAQGPATLWGIVQWGTIPGLPGKLAAVQIADYSPRLRPSWQETRLYILAYDGTWVEAHPTQGTLHSEKAPLDLKTLISPGLGSPTSLFFDPSDSAWYWVGHNTTEAEVPAQGCDERAGKWWTDPTKPWYQATWVNQSSTVARDKMYPNSTGPQLYKLDTYTQNTLQIGALMFSLSGKRYVLRGTTEYICRDRPTGWWHPHIGAQTTIETLP